uniref:Retrovirus-related Pol polyprotein from transposon TNT 1-94 n=1 Tax=Tanacetum cinerariifolium TaxID=118510 RepID=A0A6L2P2W0_TANCI|nr:hypothetical protein [Tanacetum cinerariifolium]
MYEHIGLKVTSTQDGEKILCFIDDLKKFKIIFRSSQRYKLYPKVNDHYATFTREKKGKEVCEHKNEDLHSMLGNGGVLYRAGNAPTGQGKPINTFDEQLLFLTGGQPNTFDDEVDEGPVQDMAQNEDNIFQADQFYDEAGPSCDSNTLFEVQGHDNCLDNMNEPHEEHKMHNDVQMPNVILLTSPTTVNASQTVELARYKTNHARALVHNSEDTLDIAETTRK